MLQQIATLIAPTVLLQCRVLPDGAVGGARGGGGGAGRHPFTAAEQLRQAMLHPDVATLGALVADALSYGHSSGKVDTKATFIADLLSGASHFTAITITDEVVTVTGPNAIVRHTLVH